MGDRTPDLIGGNKIDNQYSASTPSSQGHRAQDTLVVEMVM